MIKVISAVTTGAGTTGAVDASATKTPILRGTLHSVYFDYGAVTSATNVTLTTDIGTIYTVTANATDGWHFPRAVLSTKGGTAMSTASLQALFPVESWVRVSVSSGTPSTLALTAYLFIEE